MLFGMIMLVLVAAVAFFQYIQGFFSAMVSCVLVILAALIAVAYHEPVAEAVLSQHLPQYAHPVVLVAMFALVYVFLRLPADRLVPGNVRFHVMADKIGAGACGLVAGIFAVGVLALAAQMLPFGPSIGGYARFSVADRLSGELKLPKKQQLQNLYLYGELERDSLDSGAASSMFPIPLDGAVLGLTSYLSDGGSLAGDRNFARVHPDYATELFANRLGEPFQGGDVIFSGAGGGLGVSQVYTSKWVLNTPEDIEIKAVRGERAVSVPADSGTPIVVRATIQGAKLTTVLTPSAVRLALKGKGDKEPKDFYPIGSYQRGEQLVLTRPDDPIYIEAGRSVDFVFLVGDDYLVKKDDGALALPTGAFLEAKRAARADLSDKEISQNPPGGGDAVGVVKKEKQ